MFTSSYKRKNSRVTPPPMETKCYNNAIDLVLILFNFVSINNCCLPPNTDLNFIICRFHRWRVSLVKSWAPVGAQVKNGIRTVPFYRRHHHHRDYQRHIRRLDIILFVIKHFYFFAKHDFRWKTDSIRAENITVTNWGVDYQKNN